MVLREIVLFGRIVETTDYNPQALLGSLPLVKRNQKIVIQLDDDFWEVMNWTGKRIRIILQERK